MDVVMAIGTVRVVRRYRDEAIAPEVLRDLVDAGRHAGSSKNQQRWQFVVVRDRTSLQRLGKAGPYAGHVPSAAAAIALVTPAPRAGDPHSVMWDLGRAAQNIVLAAWAAGIGSCPVTVYQQAVVREALGLPDDRHCEYLLTLGYPEDPTDLTRPPRSGGRLALGEVLHEERW
jgi:nitroreductase